MKVVILAGGKGTRLSEETGLRPKPMVEVGGKPMLWHIMKIYSAHGYNDFVICLGHRGYVIKEYFANYFLHMSDVTIDLKQGSRIEVHESFSEPWRVTLVDTGEDTMTGGRVRRVRKYVGEAPFMLTYGDGVSDVDIKALVEFHKGHGKIATVTAAKPPGRFGSLSTDEGSIVDHYREKPAGDNAWINGGFFVMEPRIFDYLEDDSTVLEDDPMEGLVKAGELVAFKHTGFWQPMDTLREKNLLEELWRTNRAPWKVW